MKHSKIINAYKTLNSFAEQKLPISVSYKLWQVSNMLEPHWKFQVDKEREIFNRYKASVAPDGSVVFESDGDKAAFMKEFNDTVNELSETDVDLGDYKKVILSCNDRVDMSIEDIESLKDFVEFSETE